VNNAVEETTILRAALVAGMTGKYLISQPECIKTLSLSKRQEDLGGVKFERAISDDIKVWQDLDIALLQFFFLNGTY